MIFHRLFFSFLLFVVGQNYIFACECSPANSLEKSLENSRLVIHGKVVSKEFITYSETLLPEWADTLARRAKEKGQLLDVSGISPNIIKVKVVVLKNFKNKIIPDTLVIFTPRANASCGYTKFEIGKEFIIFNDVDLFKSSQLKEFTKFDVQLKNTFWTNQCTRTSEANQEDLDSLNLIISPIRVLNPQIKKCEYYLDTTTNEKIYTNSDLLPQFPSGQIGLMDFYKANAPFPPFLNRNSDTTLNTQVSFIVNPNGRISRIKFIKSEVKSYEKDLIQFIKKMPPWNPGKCGNNFISFEVVLNFRFEAKKEN